MSFIVAFSQSRFYDVIEAEYINDSITFGNSLLHLWNSFKDFECFDANRWILVMIIYPFTKPNILKNYYTQKDIDNHHSPAWSITQSCRKADPFN